MRIAFDTNFIAYAEGYDDHDRGARANELLQGLAHHDFVLPVQVCAELTQLVVRKFRRELREAITVVQRWRRICRVQPASTAATLGFALDLAEQHRLQIFDALILAAAKEADSRIVLSEDMGDGFIWRGVTVVNPFAATPHPIIADLLRH